MSNKDETDEILEVLDDKEPDKKPSNWELWASLYFAEFIFVLLDAGSAWSVWRITGFWYYGLIVFFAGVIPLWLYTKTYTRPLASKDQRKVAFAGGVISIASVLIVAIFMAVLSFVAQSQNANAVQWTEAGLAISLVLMLAVHGFINGRYFFLDEEISEGQKTNRIIARGNRSVQRIEVANKVANAKRREVRKRRVVADEFGPAVLTKILNMMSDDDGDGIPNFIDPVDNRPPAQRPQLPPSTPVSRQQSPRATQQPQQPTEYTIQSFLEASGLKTEQAFQDFLNETETFSKAWQVLRDGQKAGCHLPANISKRNFYELAAKVNPTVAASQSNGRR